MPIGWKLIVESVNSIDEYVARASDPDAAIAAVRKQRGMENAKITVAMEGPPKDLSWLSLSDGEADRLMSIESTKSVSFDAHSMFGKF